MKTTDIYNEILYHFADQNDDLRQWMKSPFNSGDKTFATDGKRLVAVPQIEGFEDQSSKIKGIYPMLSSMDFIIPVIELKDKLSNFPMVDSFDETEDENECSACDGTGEIELAFYHNSKSYNIPATCPVCDGDGLVNQTKRISNGKKEIDKTKFFQIGVCFFTPKSIEEVIFIAEKIEAESVNIVSQIGDTSPNLFKIKEVELIVMPTTPPNVSDIAQKIDLKNGKETTN